MKKFFYPLAILTFAIFFVMLANLNSNWVTRLDINASNLLKGNNFLEFFHYFGENEFIMIVTLLLLLWLWIYYHNYRGMMFALITVAGGNVFNRLIKEWVHRPRPIIPHQLASFSFPSGHAMMGILYIFTIAYFITEFEASIKRKVTVWSCAVIMTILIGLSRIAGSRHFASDVIAGWAMGYTFFILIVIWYERRKRIIKHHTKKA
ncbi:phosphatase PAP2 family protein [Rummeliibacillus suwonensis]|uniref:phosphatase PAP2 family protein n=1 Tax=Rummeliibacillus suwonensis TaxID=1306154 RepID=UPI001AAE3793|nr:phosphatase PAP2 family protein [Rummeliibacillus suwonensis]MBO2537379.1 phosphatase PAP2 family protein [Rummeliibacillus suwonensis]